MGVHQIEGVLEKITSTYPACAHIVEAKYHLATCLRASGDIPGCIARCSDIIAQYPESEWCDYALYYIGNSQYEMGRRDECIATYRQVIQQYPTGQWAAVAKKTLALMGAKDDAGGKQ